MARRYSMSKIYPLRDKIFFLLRIVGIRREDVDTGRCVTGMGYRWRKWPRLSRPSNCWQQRAAVSTSGRPRPVPGDPLFVHPPRVRREFCLIGALDDDSFIGIQFCFYLIFYCFSSSIKIDIERFKQRSFSSSKHRCQHFYLILLQQFKISTFTRILQFTPVTLHLLIIRKFTSLNSNFSWQWIIVWQTVWF